MLAAASMNISMHLVRLPTSLMLLALICACACPSSIHAVKPTGSKLHCRYDVHTAKQYWYKRWSLTLGCKPRKSQLGGIRDDTLTEFFRVTKATRGEWFDVLRWANKSTNCAKHPESTTCMSCSMNLPRFALEQHVVPFGVFDGWWLYPEPGATCGQCYKIMLPQGRMTPRCKKAKDAGNYDLYETYPECPGDGNSPYLTTSQEPWAWKAKIRTDKATKLPYLIGINVEWYDLDSPDEYGISYLTQGQSPTGRGSWPLKVQPIACPVGHNRLEYAFIDFDGQPEGKFWKLQVAGQRIPVSLVQVQWQGTKWYSMYRSGNRTDRGYGDADGHWQVYAPKFYSRTLPLNLRVFCANGAAPKVERGLVPSKMICRWQDPLCKRYMGKIQC